MHMSTKEIPENSSVRISLVPFRHKHIESLVEMMQSPLVRPYVDLPVSKQQFAEMVDQSAVLESFGLAVYRVISVYETGHQSGQIAGLTGYTIPEQLEQTAVLGTWLGSEFHGKGINPLVKQEMLSIAFSNPDLQQVIWLIHRPNLRAIRASEKLPYAKQLEDDSFHSYRKWYEFKTGISSVIFLVTRAAFSKYQQECGMSK